TYPNNVSYVKNANEYWVKIEITQNYINAVYAQVESEGLQNGWTQDFIDKLKTIRKPRFRGSPDTTDLDHLETDTIRWIKVTVNKAEIDFSNVKWSANSFEYNGQIQKVEISGLPSFLEPIYSDNAEAKTGNYTAVVIGFNGSDPNYKTYTNSEISAISELRHDWKITPKRVAGIWTKQNITIDDITLAIPQLKVDDNMVNAIVYKYFRDRDLKDEVTLAQIFEENDISQIKSYWVQATFTTNSEGFNNVNCIFVVEGKELDSLEEVFQTGSVINKVNIILKNNKFTYNGNPQGIELDVVGGGLTINDLVLTYKTASGTMLSGLPTNAGMYKVSVGLKSGLTDFMIVGDDEFDFEIESLRIKKPKSNQLNIFDADGFGLNDVANMPANWQNYFTILVDGNPVDENWKFAKAGNYEIEIAFKNGINTANGGDCDNVIWDDDDNTNFNITLDIESLTFVIDGWNNGTGNNRPTLIAEDRAEIEKYFDYEIYQIR
ncbi:MAG: hypothetical protein K2L47_01425, partial [Clostridia bacterium]|nr:hypothetical protein [Clostridia bacterium]